MPARVRVTPFGSLIADAARGLLMGNRGCLHNDAGEIVREITSYKGWVTCLLSFNGRKRTLRQPGRYTELFFLDEVTALAAGHRPCGTCRRQALRSFLGCMREGLRRDGPVLPRDADQLLSSERLDGRKLRRGRPVRLRDMPPGVMIARAADPARAWLWAENGLMPWTPAGYGLPEPDSDDDVVLLTPPSVVAALRAGYRPITHGTALAT